MIGSSHRLLCLTLAGRSDHIAWSALTPADWRRLAATAQAEGLAPLLYYTLKTTGWPDPMPAYFRHALQSAYYSTTARNGVFYHELSRLLAAFHSGEHGSAAVRGRTGLIVLKGGALATTLYPSLGLRPLSDLDLLVSRRHLKCAVQAAWSLGYREVYPELNPGINRQVGFHIHLRGGPLDSLAIELHWGLVAGDGDWRRPLLDWFWDQTEELNIVGQTPGAEIEQVEMRPGCVTFALQLTPTAHLLYLAAHLMYQHGGASAILLWFYDLHLLIKSWDSRIDWDELLSRAREFRWAPALQAALQGTADRFGTPLPDGFLDALAEVRDERATLLVHRKADPFQTRAVRTWNTLSCLDWRARLRLAWSILFPSPAYVRWRYKPRPEWLWPLCYGYRWWDILREALFTLVRLARRQSG